MAYSSLWRLFLLLATFCNVSLIAAQTDSNIFSVARTVKEGEKSGKRVLNLLEEVGVARESREVLRFNFRKSGLFDPNSLFVIDGDTLTIGQEPPDREQLCADRACDCLRSPQCRLNFFVDVARANEDFVWRIVNVTVNVDDVNDQPPAFALSHYVVTVQENDPQAQAELPTASDQDWGTRICRYELRDAEDSADKLTVVKRSGEKYFLALRQALNREEKSSYNVLLVATECSSSVGLPKNGSTALTVCSLRYSLQFTLSPPPSASDCLTSLSSLHSIPLCRSDFPPHPDITIRRIM